MKRKKTPLPWYAGPFIALLILVGSVGIMALMRDSEPSTMAVLVVCYMAIVFFSVRGIYAVWKNTDNEFLTNLAKITKTIMITVLVVSFAGIVWLWVAKPDDIGSFFAPIVKNVVTAILPSK